MGWTKKESGVRRILFPFFPLFKEPKYNNDKNDKNDKNENISRRVVVAPTYVQLPEYCSGSVYRGMPSEVSFLPQKMFFFVSQPDTDECRRVHTPSLQPPTCTAA